MKMETIRQLGIVIAVALPLIVIAGPSALAANSVTVTSVESNANQVDVTVPVFVRNDVTIRNLTCPLVIRKLGPAYPAKVKLDNRERLLTAINEIVFRNHYNSGVTDTANCKRYTSSQPKSPGGFLGSTLAYNGVDKQNVTGTPYGIMFQNGRLFGSNLNAGEDLIGSYLLTLDMNDQPGCFEIDTTCVDPAIHLQYADPNNIGLTPNFAQGVIQVGPCSGTAMAAVNPASMTPGNGQKGLKAVTLSWGAVADARAYEIEIDTVSATFSNLWMHRFIQATELQLVVPGDTLINKDIFWRVRATPRDCGYCFGPWSTPAKYTDVQTISTGGVPESYTLNQNYPNPFNASTVIEFTNRRDGHVTLHVYNILGQNVATLMDEYKPLGTYAVTWNGTDDRGHAVPSGMYFYRVTTDDFSAVKKMTLLK